MNCKKVQELISAWQDKELSEAEYGSIQAHLKNCPHCRLFAKEINTDAMLLKDLPEVSLPDAWHSLSQQIENVTNSPINFLKRLLGFPEFRFSNRTWLPVTALASLLIIILVGLLFQNNQHQKELDLVVSQVQTLEITLATEQQDLYNWSNSNLFDSYSNAFSRFEKSTEKDNKITKNPFYAQAENPFILVNQENPFTTYSSDAENYSL